MLLTFDAVSYKKTSISERSLTKSIIKIKSIQRNNNFTEKKSRIKKHKAHKKNKEEIMDNRKKIKRIFQ